MSFPVFTRFERAKLITTKRTVRRIKIDFIFDLLPGCVFVICMAALAKWSCWIACDWRLFQSALIGIFNAAPV